MADGAKTAQLSIEQRIDVEAVIRAAELASKVILNIYNSGQETWNVEVKSDSSPLTRADRSIAFSSSKAAFAAASLVDQFIVGGPSREANEVICGELRRIAPHVPIVSEENVATPYDVRRSYQYFWCVDPLDGTKEFIKRNGQFTVNIALVRGDTPILGVVNTPCEGRTHWSIEGKGAFVRGPDGVDTPISVAEFDTSQAGLALVGSSSHTNALTQEFIQQFRDPKFSQLGSSLKFLLVAEGKAHVYPRLAPTSEWDTCAAQVIVTEAGGTVLQAGRCDDKGQPLEDWKDALAQEEPVIYNKETFLNPYFVVYGRRRPA